MEIKHMNIQFKKFLSPKLFACLWAAAVLVSGIALLMLTSLRIDIRMRNADNVDVSASYDEVNFFYALESGGGHRRIYLPLYNFHGAYVKGNVMAGKPLRIYFDAKAAGDYGISSVTVGGGRVRAKRIMRKFLPNQMLFPGPDGAIRPEKPQKQLILAKHGDISKIVNRILIARNFLIAIFSFCCAGLLFSLRSQFRRVWDKREMLYRDYYCIQLLLVGALGSVLMVLQLVSVASRLNVFPPLAVLLSLGSGLALEVLLLAFVSRLIGMRHWWTRLPVHILTLLVIVFYAGEIGSLAIGGETLTLAALENISVIKDLQIPWWGYALTLAGLLLAFGLLVLAGKFDRYGRERKRFSPVLAGLVILAAGSTWFWFEEPNYDYRYAPLPLAELTGRMRTAWLTTPERGGGAEQNFFRDTVAPPLPFPRKAELHKPNVIVFFIEGLSARLIGCYGGIRPNLTPEIDAFARRPDVMQVRRYYNHTAFTFRGIFGQCTSSLSLGGVESNFDDKRTLPGIASILGDNGYDTVFFYSQPKELDRMLNKLDFSEIYNLPRIKREKLTDSRADDYLSDEELFGALVSWLERRPKNAPPFLIGLYNFETHAFLGSPRRSKCFDPASPSATFDQTHHLDMLFGRFVKWFMASPYSRNTVLVFTSDHAHYHGDAPFAALMKSVPGYQPLPFDRIPLLIYDPGHKLPKTLDARCGNSIDFAPTILQLLGVTEARNAFLGKTLFDRSSDFSIACGGDQFFLVSNGRLKPLNDERRASRDVAALLRRYREFGKFIQLNSK